MAASAVPQPSSATTGWPSSPALPHQSRSAHLSPPRAGSRSLMPQQSSPSGSGSGCTKPSVTATPPRPLRCRRALFDAPASPAASASEPGSTYPHRLLEQLQRAAAVSPESSAPTSMRLLQRYRLLSCSPAAQDGSAAHQAARPAVSVASRWSCFRNPRQNDVSLDAAQSPDQLLSIADLLSPAGDLVERVLHRLQLHEEDERRRFLHASQFAPC